jgi:hypothetical protein
MGGSAAWRGLVVATAVIVGGWVLAQCASGPPPEAPREPRAILQRTIPQRPTANRTPPLKSKTTGPASGCGALLERYQHETARIPYPANLPIRAMLGVGVQLVRRYDHLPDRDRECRALLRMTLDRFFVRSVGPGVAPTPLLPVAAANQ